MKLVIIDLETTGLRPYRDQVLSCALVLLDTESIPESVFSLPAIEFRLKRSEIRGQPFALQMNAELIRQTLEGTEQDRVSYISHDLLPYEIHKFLADHHWVDGETRKSAFDHKLIWCGKNVASFDLQFLLQENDGTYGYHLAPAFAHRTFDIGSYMATIADEMVPDLKECMTRANIQHPFVEHQALADCYDVARCIMYKES